VILRGVTVIWHLAKQREEEFCLLKNFNTNALRDKITWGKPVLCSNTKPFASLRRKKLA
jgi:hypothetical protein